MNAEDRLIAEAAAANRALGASGQSDMVWGHASVRDPEGRGVWMKAAGWSFQEATSARVALVTPAGEVLAGSGPRHIEYPIHTEVMKARPDVSSVVHTHAPAASPSPRWTSRCWLSRTTAFSSPSRRSRASPGPAA